MSAGGAGFGGTPPIVCFDWGGVILRICASWDEARERSGLDHRSIPCDPAMRARRHSLLREYETGRIACDEFFDGVSVEMDRLYLPTEIRRVHDAWLIEEYRGAREMIQELRLREIETALLSNTNERHWQRHMAIDGRSGDFPAISMLCHRAASHRLGLAKPDARIFRAARSLFEHRTDRGGSAGPAGASRPILFFDDRVENVLAARDAGWLAERVDPLGDPPAQVRQALIKHGIL